jgi:hypothetical protein
MGARRVPRDGCRAERRGHRFQRLPVHRRPGILADLGVIVKNIDRDIVFSSND